MEGPGFIIINFNLNGVRDVGESERIPPKIHQGVKGGLEKGIFPQGSEFEPRARVAEMGRIFETLRGYQR